MPRLSSLITKGLNTPYVEPGYWHIPTGAVIIYGGSSDPGLTGWSRYSAADGYYIKGTATQGEIGTTSGGNTTGSGGVSTTGTGGAHAGSGVNLAQTYFNGTSSRTNYGTAGGHTHTLTYSLGAGSDLNPNTRNAILLKATQEQKYFPANTWHIRSTQVPSSTQVVANYTNEYFRGAATSSHVAATVRDFSGTTNAAGGHDHQTAYTNDAGSQTSPGGAGAWTLTTFYLPGGSSPFGTTHTHTVSATIQTTALDAKLLKLWNLASESLPENNVIIMFTGNISDLRDYWQVCDGTRGTPDMRGYFLGYSGTAATAHDTTTTFTTSIGGGSTMGSDTWNHGHISTGYSSTGWIRTLYHSVGAQSHTHTFVPPSSTIGYTPLEIKVCFIQLIKTA